MSNEQCSISFRHYCAQGFFYQPCSGYELIGWSNRRRPSVRLLLIIAHCSLLIVHLKTLRHN
jgi:hypothetical protein